MPSITRRPSAGQARLRRAIYPLRTSVIITVALVPPLLDQLFRLFPATLSPLWLASGLLLLIVVVFLLLSWRELRLTRAESPEDVRPLANPEWIESIVATAFLPDPLRDDPESAQSLARNLPSLTAIRLVLSEGTDAEGAKQRLAGWIAQHVGRPISIDTMSTRIDLNQITQKAIDGLAGEFAALQNTHTAVDITGGNKVMALVSYQAAASAGLPVTYIIQRDRNQFVGLSVVSDPSEAFGPAASQQTKGTNRG